VAVQSNALFSRCDDTGGPLADQAGAGAGAGAGAAAAAAAAGGVRQPPMSRQQYMRLYRRRYTARYVPAETIVQGGLQVSLSMFDDHMPDKQLKSIKLCHMV